VHESDLFRPAICLRVLDDVARDPLGVPAASATSIDANEWRNGRPAK
jgi:hypothetical protein